ncbi:copper chaperone PCu(A)C [Pseudaestuariivita atlantica]|uniref:Copper chaperone PCu(A)C n=1 Tax=Pseudaestuariivita atlantica TaxID=1317121 RepID=A0A0L1JL12_9RHOB|nr:copper chaperone PCu(A)C [Pseudaestuariivita atlantica]KNG92431.1 hypothetical protein ATO11_17645 [Pseudaestuariivita atlantica]
MRAAILALLFASPALADGLHVGEGWMAATEGQVARAFVEIHNEGDAPVILHAFRADWADAALVGAPVKADGRDVPLDDYMLLPGEELDMEPEGVFIRLTDLTVPLAEGTEADVTLILSTGTEIAITIQVEGENAETESHAGHDH